MNNEEKVLCFPAKLLEELGTFSGFNANYDNYVKPILDSPDLMFIPRSKAETDPNWKQIIPYMILKDRHHDDFFAYRRGAKGGDSRLMKLRSIGVGGHINDSDMGEGGWETFQNGERRELSEEVNVGKFCYEERTLGVLYDPSTEVGRVHFGIIKQLDVLFFGPGGREFEVMDEAIVEHGMVNLESLIKERSDFEAWSQLTIDYLDRKRFKAPKPNFVSGRTPEELEFLDELDSVEVE